MTSLVDRSNSNTTIAMHMDTLIDINGERQKRKRPSSTDTSSSSSDSDFDGVIGGLDDPPTSIPHRRGWLIRGWSQLNIDFIESITPFLRKREISYLHRTWHSWLHIADHIRSPHLDYYVPKVGRLRMAEVVSGLVHSLVRRHVKQLVLSELVAPVELELVAQHLPKLQQLRCWIGCTENSSWIFPSQLKEFSVNFNMKALLPQSSLEAISNSMNACLVSLSHLTSLNSLDLSIYEEPAHTLSPINLQPLTRLAHSLNYLILNMPLTMSHILALRQLVNLKSLKLLDGQITHKELSELLAEPVPFPRLEMLTPSQYEYANEDVPLLKRLTHLTEFDVWKNHKLADLSFPITHASVKRDRD